MTSLPIHRVLSDIQLALRQGDELVLQAPPGAGKTTVVPLELLQEDWLQGQTILMLEPRRLAARAAAERMAQTLGERVGETVGYRVRLDSKVGPYTRIEVVTEGILTRRLQDDPALEGVGLLIFDEFHERSLDGDLGLALTLQGRELFGDLREQPLKLLVMSATLDGTGISKLLGDALIITSEGRMFPVDIRYGSAYRYGEWIADRVVTTIWKALNEETGSLLVFLPGQAEIRRVFRQLQERLADAPGTLNDSVLLTPLFGELSLSDQRRAIEPAGAGCRKIVLATAIAETSLTIDGVRVVIDCGLSRLPAFDPNTGMTRLETRRVSRASATQRCGRAGRLEPGVCYRLWSASQQDELPAFTPPEIQQADLAPLALQLLNWGVDDLAELAWLDRPAAAPYQQALELLQQLEAVNRSHEQWQMTKLGKVMAGLPVHPRLAHMMLKAKGWGRAALGCELAALLSERDLMRDSGADIHLRLELLRGERRCDTRQKGRLSRVRQQQKQLSRLLSRAVCLPIKSDAGAEILSDADAVGLLLACAYPDRIARQRVNNRQSYQLSNGRSADFMNSDALAQKTWLVISDLGGKAGRSSDCIFLASAFNSCLFQSHLQAQIADSVCVEWDEEQGKLVAETQRHLGRLLIERQPLKQLSDEARQQALLGLVRKRGLSLLNWTPEVQQWCARVELLRQLELAEDSVMDSGWPDLSEQGLLGAIEQWLAPYLNKVSKLSHFKSLDLMPMLQTLLPWPLPQVLNEQAPLRIEVPSGSAIAIDYSQTPPVLAVKLQEMFGCQHTPAIARGRIKLMVHLLSPARRPLQVTQDLAGFWSGGYVEVKKEMKGRYPKHPWPDNPLQAMATAKVKARM